MTVTPLKGPVTEPSESSPNGCIPGGIVRLAKVFPRFQIAPARISTTAFAGLPLFTRLAESLGLIPALEERLHFLKHRQRGYSVWQFVLSLMLLLIAGGESLTDIQLLQADRSLKRLLGWPRLPAATTLGQFLHRCTRRALGALSTVVTGLATKTIQRRLIRAMTLDFDATLMESHKRNAQYTDEKFPGYDPRLGFVAETKMVRRGLFRPGNASPGANALSFLRGSLKLLPPWISSIRIRSDSAWYNHQVMDYCHDRGIQFTITAVLTEPLIAAAQAIPERLWRYLDQTNQVAETIHVVGDSSRSYRAIVLRSELRQTDAFTGAYSDYVIMTNINDWTPAQVARWHRRRANAENIIKELKHGFGLGRLPCGELLANAAYFEANLLADNLVQLYKQLVLPAGWQQCTIKMLRLRLVNIGAVLVRHGRELRLKVPADHPYWQLLAHSRDKILRLAPQ